MSENSDIITKQPGIVTGLLIIPCSCELYLGQLPKAAGKELAAGDAVRCIGEEKVRNIEFLQQELQHADRSIVVDGCEKECIKRLLRQHNLESEFHLTATDLGIVEKTGSGLIREDLDLVRDAIIATATRVTGTFPKFSGCGCC